MEIITFNEIPTSEDWELETIYRKTQDCNISSWTIRYLSEQKQLEVETGLIGSDLNIYYLDIVIHNSDYSYNNQALKRAKQNFIKKVQRGYSREEGHSTPIFKPQLAQKYLTDYRYNLENFEAGIACQAKKHGIRAITTLAGSNVIISTREGNRHYHLEELRKELRIFLMYFPRQCVIDGELLIDGIPFSELQSIVRTSSKKLPRNDEVDLYVFDIIIDVILEERINLLLEAYQQFTNDNPTLKRIKLLQHMYAFDEETLEDYYSQFLAVGNEGMMMRQLMGGKAKFHKQSLYTQRRSKNLLKYKPFDDAEGIIVAVKQGKNKDKDKAIFVIELNDGQQISLKPGTDKERIEYLRYPSKYIGRTVTYKYRGFTETGLPKYPSWLYFRSPE